MIHVQDKVWQIIRHDDAVFVIPPPLRKPYNIRYQGEPAQQFADVFEPGTMFYPIAITGKAALIVSLGGDKYQYRREGDDTVLISTWGHPAPMKLPPYLRPFVVDGCRIHSYCESPCGMMYYVLLTNNSLYLLDKE